jgi:signal transduction histidine kinase
MARPGGGEPSQHEDPEMSGRQQLDQDAVESAFFDRLADPLENEVRLPALPQSAPVARRVTCSVLLAWGLGRYREAAEQLVGELFANAVHHTGGRTVGLRLARKPGRLRVEVCDPSRALPCLIRAEPDADSGRGLQVVDATADRWGADLLPRGKCVWFELRLRER